jgi:peptidoglycan/xylan/chitin deacetylase (PgdA/CDA1 family)
MRAADGRPPLALVYHGVADVPRRRDPHGLCIPAGAMRRQIAWLRRRGYALVTFGELVRRSVEGLGAGLAALTFDDGFADNLHALVPLLEGLPATVFAASGWLGREHPDVAGARIADAEELRRLHAAEVEIGAHTVTHPDLTTLDFGAAREELERSRIELEAIIQAPVTSAAYPYGRAYAETVRACAAAGFAAAGRTTAQGALDRPLDFPRQDMTDGASLLGLRLKAADRYEPLMRHRPLRAVRRARRTVVRALP